MTFASFETDRMGPDELGGLIDRHAAALRLFARQRTSDADDVVQEAFVRLVGLAEAPRDPVAWLYRAVRNGAINAGIAASRRRKHEGRASARAAGLDPVGDDPPIAPEVAEAALAELPVDQREVIVAHLWGGLSFDQAGSLVGTSASSAHRRYHAGLMTLRDRLGVPCPSRKPT